MKTLVRQDATLFPSLPSLLDDFLNRNWADSTLATAKGWATLPAVNVCENNDEYIIDVAAPGMKREEFRVEIANNVLTISSQREEKEDNMNFTRREFNYQSFQRTFTLPENKVEGEKISAKYTDGILRITVPKKDEAKVKPIKQIAIG